MFYSRFLKGLFILSLLYYMYLIKTALGINISHKYHAPDLFKLPLKALLNHSHVNKKK